MIGTFKKDNIHNFKNTNECTHLLNKLKIEILNIKFKFYNFKNKK